MNSYQSKSAVPNSLTLATAAICVALMSACATVSDSASVSDGADSGLAKWEMPIDRGTGTN